MKTKYLALAFIFTLLSNCAAFADRQLSRNEILQIFEKLTDGPKKTWTPTGTINATHEEYRAPKTTNSGEVNNRINEEIQEYQRGSNQRELTEELQKMELDAIPFNVRYRLLNEYTMNSTVVVRYDGNKFYWEINASSRRDSVRPDADLEHNPMTKEFNMDWNKRRIFAWDGERYTIYTSGNNAYIDVTNSTPHVVNGPLTAGVIPWGYGNYTYRNLSAAECSGKEENSNGRTQVRLTLNLAGSEMVLVMDPDKDYSVLYHEINGSDATEFTQCDGYQLVSGSWVPRNIYIEKRDASTNRLLSYDRWNLTRINSQTPSSWSFNVDYENDTLIEYRSYVSDKPAMYRYAYTVDTDMLLAERLSFAAAEGIQPQNCATTALKYAAQQLGKNVTDRQLTQLISGQDSSTSLYAMKQFAQRLGLYCRAVKLDIQALKNMDNCHAILHIPGKSHFIVFGGTDSKYVFCIDLANDKFLYRTKLDFFGMDWTEGTALLISDKPIVNQYTNINDDKLRAITGGSGYYSCTKLLQESDYVYCSYVGGYCGGYYEVYWTRYGCEPAESGSCSTSYILRAAETPCILDYYGTGCTVTGEWTTYYMQACD
jgi:hypothetical protein